MFSSSVKREDFAWSETLERERLSASQQRGGSRQEQTKTRSLWPTFPGN